MPGEPEEPEAGQHATDDATAGPAQVHLVRGSAPWSPFGSGGPRRCSFCGRREDAVGRLVVTRDARICDRCVELAGEAVAAAPPDRTTVRMRVRPRFPADRAVAEEEIEHAFETAIGADTPDDERLKLIEGSANLREALAEVGRRLPPGQRADTFVDQVRFLSADEAQVQFVLVYPGGSQAPQFPQSGHAILSGGRWKVARETWCNLVRMIGVHCPPPRDEPGARNAGRDRR